MACASPLPGGPFEEADGDRYREVVREEHDCCALSRVQDGEGGVPDAEVPGHILGLTLYKHLTICGEFV